MRELLLDACVIINLAASGVPLQDLASGNRVDFVMTRRTAEEALYLDPVDEGGAQEEIDVVGFARQGALLLIDLLPDELSTFIELARHVDDGEAATLSVSVHRGWACATDDRKAQRLALEVEPPLEIVTTSSLMYGWAENRSVPAPQVHHALQGIERRASFVPRASDPYQSWWTGITNS